MKYLFNIIFLVFFPITSSGTGIPIFDGHEVMKQISDSLYFITSIETLLSEVGGSGSELAALSELTKELKLYQEQVSLYEQLGGAIDDASSPSMGRSKVLVDQINSVSRHLRKLKVVLALAKSIGARPEAVNSSIQILQDERNREKEKFEAAYKAFEEKERLRGMRFELTKKVRFKEAINREIEIINGFSNNKTIKPILYSSKSKLPFKQGPLW